MEAEPVVVLQPSEQGVHRHPNPKESKWAKETTSFCSGLASTTVCGGTLHPNALVASGITALCHIWLNTLRATDDSIHCVIMVLAGGIGSAKGIIGWRAKALGWKEEI